MSGGVDKIEHVFLPAKFVFHLYGVALDGYASFALKVHIVEYLSFHVLGGHGIGVLKQTVGKG